MPQSPHPMLLKIIWFSFVFTSILFLAALYVTLGKVDSPATSELSGVLDLQNPTEQMFLLVAVLFFGISYALPRVTMNMTTNPMQIFIMRLVLCEVGILFGFCLAFVSKEITKFYPFLTIGLIVYFLIFPKDSLDRLKSSDKIGLS